MKRILSILSILSIFSCKESKRIYQGDPEFEKIESVSNVRIIKAIEIYESNFQNNFNFKIQENESSFYRIIFIENNFYNIGFIHKLDKNSIENAKLWYLSKINLESGDISVVKQNSM